jgi:hypothetical protein
MDEIEAKPQSKALPIAVSGGIAVLVFGVLFAVRSGGPAKPPGPGPADTPTKEAPVADKPVDKPADKPATPVATGAPDATPAVAAAPAPDAAKAAEGPHMTTLTFDIKPAEAKVIVNGKPLAGDKIQFQTGDYKVKVEARAPGYQPLDEEVPVDKDSTVSVELKKELAATKPDVKTPTKTPPPRDTTTPTTPVHKPVGPKKPKVDL